MLDKKKKFKNSSIEKKCIFCYVRIVLIVKIDKSLVFNLAL